MKYLIAGLGNPGAEYRNTRHNIGFEVLDRLAEKEELIWSIDKLVLKAEMKHKGRTLVLIKPQTFMNLSGKALAYWMQKEKLNGEHVLVVTDDLALPMAKLRMRAKGSDGGHNGLKSISEVLGHGEYNRLRFGIGNDFPQGRQVEYVLGRWSEDEQAAVNAAMDKALEGIKLFVSQGPGPAMTRINAG